MRFFLAFVTVSLLIGGSAIAQGPPAPPWAGVHGNGQPPHVPVDPLASSHWQPGPVMPPNAPGGGFGMQPRPFGAPPSFGGPGGWPGAHPGFGGPGGPPGAPPGGQPGLGSDLQLESDFRGPTAAIMYVHVPKTFKKGNGVILALHHCDGTGPGYFRELGELVRVADQKGYLIISPSSPGGSAECWDVSSRSSLKHDGGGDSETISKMVKYAAQKYGCSEKAYVIGHSSGAMLTQVMGAVYPDLVIAGAAYSGVPAGCFRTERIQGKDWNSTCTSGTLNESPQYWVQQAKEMFPAYQGEYPRMMLVHGRQDAVINFNDHREAVKQWCGLHGINPDRPDKTYALPSQPNYEVSAYGSSVLAVAASGVTHDNPTKVDLTVQFFNL